MGIRLIALDNADESVVMIISRTLAVMLNILCILYCNKKLVEKLMHTVSEQLLLNDHPFVNDVINDYIALRSQGFSKNNAVTRIKNDWHEELNDKDDALFVAIGIALALSEKQELTPQAKNDALTAVRTLKNRSMISEQDYDKIMSCLSDDRIGISSASAE